MCDRTGAVTKFTSSSGVVQCLAQRETGWAQGLTQLAQSHRFYSFIVPNTSAKLVAAGATSLHFSPCGKHILGVTGNGHNVSLWDVDKFLGESKDESPGSRRNEAAALRPDRGAQGGRLAMGTAAGNGQPLGPGTSSQQDRNGSPVMLAAAFPIAPAIDFSATLRNSLSSAASNGSALGKRSRAAINRSWSGTSYLSPVDVPSESILEDARGLLSPGSRHNDAMLYELWKQRSREQQAMIASWEEEQGRRRRRQARISAAAAAEENSFLPEPAKPSQPTVTRAPRVRECLNMVPPTRPTRTGHPAASPTPATPYGVRVPTLSLTHPRFSSSVTSGGETLIDDVCLFTHDLKYVLLISETQPEQAAGTPMAVCASTSILMISLQDGTVVDRVQLQNERLILRTNRAGATWSLLKSTLVVLLPHNQQIHIMHCSSEGALVHRRTIGRFLQHDDELILSTFDSQEDLFQARCAAEPRAEAHGRLLPAQVTALMSLYNTPRSAVASRHPPAQDPTARTDAATGVGSPTPVAAPAAAQASNSTGVSTGASSEDGLEPVTGLWQRMAAFLYKRALEGEEIGLSDLFDSSYPQDRCNRDVCELVNIVQRSTSLADAMERMTGVPPHSRPAPSPAAAGLADASVSKALRQFHRYRADLDSLFISAVHLLQAGRLLMLLTSRRNRLMPMVVLYDWEADTVLFASALYTVKVVVCMMWYSEQLNHLHRECMWRSYMPHLHVMAQQLETLASHPASVAQAGGAGAVGVATQSLGGVASHASSSVSRSSTPPPTLRTRAMAPSLTPTQSKPAAGHETRSPARSSFAIQQRMLKIVAAARKVGPERMRQFMMWHLPGASQAMLSSPYTDPLVYRVIRHERMVHLHASRWLRFLASQPKIEFYHIARSSETPAFELDCSMVGSTGHVGHASAQRLCLEMKFHPSLPIVISCFPMYSCFVVHYRLP